MSIERKRLDAAGADTVRRASTRRFAALLLAQACLLLGSVVLCFAYPLYVLDETGSATAYGLVGAVSFLPYLAATPLGGVLADRADCGRIFSVLGMALAAVTACMPLCRNAFGCVSSTIVLLCTDYAAQAICKPAVQAAIPELLGEDQVERGCAWASQVTMGANILGPFAGAALYGWAGIDGAGAVASLGFAFSAIVGTLFSRAPSCNKERDAKKGQGPDLGLRNAIAFFGAKQTLLLTVLLVALFNLALAGASLGTPVVVSVHLGASAQWVGLIEGTAGAGGLVGGLMVGMSPYRFNAGHMGRYILLSTLGVVPVLDIVGDRRARMGRMHRLFARHVLGDAVGQYRFDRAYWARAARGCKRGERKGSLDCSPAAFVHHSDRADGLWLRLRHGNACGRYGGDGRCRRARRSFARHV